ncbi:MAG: hypothetical protein HY319_15745 [Armatimonadetes bacterium]|nr:hypothetical protein [Armatimonadota bacterium]
MERLQALAGVVPAPKSNGKARPKPKERPASEDHLPGGYTRPQLLERVTELYRQRFLESKEAQEYLAGRGLGSPELWQTFRVGYAGGVLNLPDEGPIREAMQQLGVLDRRGREHFRGCIVVPLEHPDLGVVGLYGRAIDLAHQAWHHEQASQIAQSLGMKLVPRADRPWVYRMVPLDSEDQ